MALVNHDFLRILILSIVLGSYCIIGAAIFHLMENENEEGLLCHLNNVRTYIMEKYNMTAKDFDWFVGKVQHALYHHCQSEETHWCKTRWTYYGALYFTTTIVTTIGYGHLAPRTFYGRMFFMIFAIFGIPIYVMLLKQVGDRLLELIHSMIIYVDFKRHPEGHLHNVRLQTLAACIVLFFIVTLIGGILYKFSEKWKFMDAVYYCFQAITTVGFGDFIPNDGRQPSGPLEIFNAALHFIILFLGLVVLFTLLASIAAASDELRITFPNLLGKRTVEEVMIETEIQRYGAEEVLRRRSMVLLSPPAFDSPSRVENHAQEPGNGHRRTFFKISPYGSPASSRAMKGLEDRVTSKSDDG